MEALALIDVDLIRVVASAEGGGVAGLPCHDVPQYEVIRLEPRSTDSQVQDIRLWVKDLKQIHRIEIVDNFETRTIINISHIEENSLTSEGKPTIKDLFNFAPPPGTEIIRQ